jgi:hypothetical protein
MIAFTTGGAGGLLPLLLSLPGGVIAGLPGAPGTLPEQDLTAFGPRLRSEAALRHATLWPPARAVVEFGPDATLASEAALAALSEAGAAVALLSADVGALARLCHRILAWSDTGFRWAAAQEVRDRRRLLVRVAHADGERWLRVPLGAGGAEGALSGCRARGLLARESRVDYGRLLPR